MQQGRLQRGRHQRFQVAPANFRVGVFRPDHLALFGQANLPAHRAWRLGQDGLVAGATAAAYCAAPAMEQSELDLVCFGELVKQLDQHNLGAVKLPVAGENATVLVAVGVTQHDLLLAAAARYQLGNAGQGVKLAHDGRGMAQVFNRLKQRHNNQVVACLTVQRALHQPHFLLQQQHLQQVAHRLGVTDDVVAYGLPAKALARCACGFKDGQLALGMGRIGGADHAQGPRIVEQADQQRAFGSFVEAGVIGFNARDRQQLRHHLFVLVRALPQIDRGQMKTEHVNGPYQRVQPLGSERFSMMRSQRSLDGAQVGQKIFGTGIGVLRRKGMTRRIATGQLLQRGGQPGVDACQRAAGGLVLAVLAGVGGAVCQRAHLGAEIDQQRRQGQLAAQKMHLRQVVAQGDFGLTAQRVVQCFGADIRVPVAVAAYPLAHA